MTDTAREKLIYLVDYISECNMTYKWLYARFWLSLFNPWHHVIFAISCDLPIYMIVHSAD
jgi:hypothetical protein